jgi:DNA-binding transcriptional LysR family regulator
MRCLSVRRKELWRGASVASRRFGRRAGFKPRFVRYGETLANTLSLVVSENAVAFVPDYVRQILTPGVAVRPIVDPGATWDFLVVWQRGPTPPPMRAFLGALTLPVGKQPHE